MCGRIKHTSNAELQL